MKLGRGIGDWGVGLGFKQQKARSLFFTGLDHFFLIFFISDCLHGFFEKTVNAVTNLNTGYFLCEKIKAIRLDIVIVEYKVEIKEK